MSQGNYFDLFLSRKYDETIVVDERMRQWTYAELTKYALFAKEYFIKNKIKIVMITLPQGFYAYSVIWGAYLAGITFCPVTIGVPDERMKYYENELRPDLKITPDNAETFFSNPDSSYEFLNRNEIVPAETAYIIFTSGSTGQPKGVKIPREGLHNFLNWSTVEYGIGKDDIWGQYSNIGFDLSLCDIFTAVICGAKLVPFESKGEKLMPGLLIKNKKITFWHSTPSVIDMLQQANHLTQKNLQDMKAMSFCGEKLYPSQLELLFQAKPDLVVYNTYGPTEGTIFCTYICLTKETYRDQCEKTVSIGAVIPGYGMIVNQEKDGLGEIVITGSNIGIGYLNRDNNAPGSPYRLTQIGTQLLNTYHTGDYAYYINNKIFVFGRKDSQGKIMGNRVDLSELDLQLRNFGCSSAHSVFNNKKIVSFIVIESFSEKAIRDFLSRYLPSYYLPHKIIQRENMPYNASGKIDSIQLIQSI